MIVEPIFLNILFNLFDEYNINSKILRVWKLCPLEQEIVPRTSLKRKPISLAPPTVKKATKPRTIK